MRGEFATWRSVRGLMAGSALAALVLLGARSIVGPEPPRGERARWLAAACGFTIAGSLMLAGLPWAAGPPRSTPSRPCPGCGRPELRPVLGRGVGLFDPAPYHRCAGCGTIDAGGPGRGGRPAAPPIVFLDPPQVDRSGIVFLDE